MENPLKKAVGFVGGKVENVKEIGEAADATLDNFRVLLDQAKVTMDEVKELMVAIREAQESVERMRGAVRELVGKEDG